jgi:hypothetical protein
LKCLLLIASGNDGNKKRIGHLSCLSTNSVFWYGS